MLEGRHIVLGVTGGIAAYKACDLASRLVKKGACVRVVMTENAASFVSPLTFQTLTGCAVHTGGFALSDGIAHIENARWADAMVIAPATANCLAKLRAGLADDILSSTALALSSPLLVAPAMNSAMWRNAATQENVLELSARGVRFVGPGTGRLACGDDDVGRMSEPEEIVQAIDELLDPRQDLAGRRVLVTAGPTIEDIDPVRYITNRSSGKMGYAIAQAAAARGATVTLISGPVALQDPAGVETVHIRSSRELCEAVLSHAETADTVIQAAAPADYAPEAVSGQKIKKNGEGLLLRLVNTVDIARTLGERKRPGQMLVAFAAETESVQDNAREKLEKKNADLIVANDVTMQGAGFGVDTNIVKLITREDVTELPIMSKRDVADAILDRVAAFFGA